jgi:hypothetical protein
VYWCPGVSQAKVSKARSEDDAIEVAVLVEVFEEHSRTLGISSFVRALCAL